MTERTGAGLLRKMIMKWTRSIFNGGAGKRKKGSRRTRPLLVGRERKRERKEEMHFSSQIHGSITKHVTMRFKFKHRVIFSTMLLYMIVPNYDLSLLMLEEIQDISGRSWVFR